MVVAIITIAAVVLLVFAARDEENFKKLIALVIRRFTKMKLQDLRDSFLDKLPWRRRR